MPIALEDPAIEVARANFRKRVSPAPAGKPTRGVPSADLPTHGRPPELAGPLRALITATLARPRRPDQLALIERLTGECVRTGIDLETVLHALHAQAIRRFSGHPFAAAADPHRAARTTGLALLDALTAASTIITTVYLRELCDLDSERHRAEDSVADAVLDGHPAKALARATGIDIADRYVVLAIHFAEATPGSDSDSSARVGRASSRLRAALAARCEGHFLARLSDVGGTLLLPAHSFTDSDVDELITILSLDTGTSITAVAFSADRDHVPGAADEAHQFLDTVLRRTSATTGLHRPDHVALEHQLARPGRARDTVAAVLAPLDEHPDLMATLLAHVRNDGDRAASAAQLAVHSNTISHRLTRIATLTGHDPRSNLDLWKLQCALVARGGLGMR
ncbi:helix-turn-helix domain-containing protein [Nocardia salmonicida]|uniref:PucR family transcriptional regulator n=1 Tax=Nocardia salmonicida TaxID=53431 RepID=UPI0034145F28